jgi:DNA uptake protein ComE-like DNA-binding protein
MKWFLAGLGVGVAFGIVMAPARGEETRRNLRNSANRTWDEMSDEARAALDDMRSSDWARQARDAATQARQRVTTMTRDVQNRVGEVANQVRERVPEVVNQVRDRVPDNIRQAMDRVSDATGIGTPEQGNGGDGQARASLLELLNEGTQDELIAVNGIGPVLALKIVQHRPYKSEQQPLEDNVIPPSAFEALRDHLKTA